ncbi:MAG TPA: prenyltransferase/squalene oxidase repeat-containing protein [Solirubrobacteraceae bacterium]|jgi:hypothetical protein|nr:prenyltransferase/squalene oxidase repeat-containing protein [Solirubrobacteraceae bacterium]
MSWPLATFLIVGLILLAGWIAYERSRPSTRMVAVVATLAAVAALGRDAFVALPEVKPITAIVLVVGYALGPLPGFTVGAMGMLASNIMLGQGSYTPWQMVAWGMVGLVGAVLGQLTGRRLGRLPLALACALTALAAKEVMNVYTWTIGATHTPAAFLLIAGGAALPFDLVDAGASFFFGLAFAPELARVLARVRARMDIHWEAAPASAPVLLAVALGLAGALLLPGGSARAGVSSPTASPVRLGVPSPTAFVSSPTASLVRVGVPSPTAFVSSPTASPVRVGVPSPTAFVSSPTASLVRVGVPSPPALMARAGVPGPTASAARINVAPELAYLASAQNPNGGWGSGPGQPSSELYTAWAAIGLAAAKRNPQSVRRDGHSALNALASQAGTLEGPGDDERTILALRACGAPVGSLAGKNLLGNLLRYRRSNGSFSNQVNLTAFAIFALRAAGHSAGDPAVRAAGAWIVRQEDADGGFNFAGRSSIGRGGASDVDDTAAALQGLIDAGASRSAGGGAAIAHALAFLVGAQNPDGGFPARRGGESNAQSTAWAVQAFAAAGYNVEALHRHGSRSPLGYLESLVAPNGSVRYSRTSTQTPVWVTAQALTALARAPFPIG